jgi:hypothetical protein
LATIDQRSVAARRWRDVYDQIAADLGGDPSMAQMQLVRRAATIAVQCEVIEASIATGEMMDVKTMNVYGQMADRLGRCLQRLGIKRVPRDVTPKNLRSYLTLKARPPTPPTEGAP